MRRGLPLVVGLMACGGAPPEPEPGVCTDGVSQSALEAVDRKIVGGAAPYEADASLRARDHELAHSQRLRREVAWQTISKVLATVPLAQHLPNAARATIPIWQTWYDLADERRVFHRLYGELSAEQRARRAPFGDADLDAGFEWNVDSLSELPNWPTERYDEYVAAIDDRGKVAGLGGISRVGYSPAAARHLIASYPEVLACRSDGPPDALVEGSRSEVRLVRAAVHAAACGSQRVGSFDAGFDEVLRATLEDGDTAAVHLRSTDSECTATAGNPCEVRGPATFELVVDAGDTAVDSFVTVTRETAHPEWAACLREPFPIDAAVVKADWRRAQFGIQLPTFSTSAQALAERLTGDLSWDEPDGEADPGPDDIYSLQLANGNRYRLAALHLMTKELDHWIWITLWWSPSPDEDFGADRPEELSAMDSPWRHYKMCVVTAFDEQDADPTGGFDEDHPSLAHALAAVHGGIGGPSWCSNPYLEQGHGNAATNCIGCHQHAGTDLLATDIVGSERRFPEHGRTQLRNNFPTDYSWAVDQGDELGQLFEDEEDYYKQ